MKNSWITKIIGIVVLGLLLLTPSQADDIKDFQIEGISVGDSLLDHFTKKEIDGFYLERFPKNDFITATTSSEKFENYDAMQFVFKPNDQKYFLHGVAGIIAYKKNLDACYKKKDEIVNELASILKNFYKEDLGRINNPPGADPYGGTYDIVFFNKNRSKDSDRVQVSCNDWSEQSGIVDSVKVELYLGQFAYWLDYVAYN